MSNLAPIALFVFKRPWHTRQVLTRLSANTLADKSHLYIFADGPKEQSDDSTLSAIADVRRVIRERQWCRKVTIIVSETNRGLANSIIGGVTELVNNHGKVIVIEDDLLTAPAFLQYMNMGIEMYQDSEQVMQVSGFMFPIKVNPPEDSFLIPLTTSWGWATWKRAWDFFDPHAKGYQALTENANLRNSFNLNGVYDYYGMLANQLAGRIDSWAIRWYLTVFLQKGLVLYPKQSLIHNIGFDNSGEHCGSSDAFANMLSTFHVESFPEKMLGSDEGLNKIIKYIASVTA